MSVPHVFCTGLAQIMTLGLRYDGGESEDLELSSHEGLAARGREIGQAIGHRSADIQINMDDWNSQRLRSSLR
jgi:hypothetical protein